MMSRLQIREEASQQQFPSVDGFWFVAEFGTGPSCNLSIGVSLFCSVSVWIQEIIRVVVKVGCTARDLKSNTDTAVLQLHSW